MKMKKTLAVFLSVFLVLTQISVCFAAENENAVIRLIPGDVIDGKNTLIVVAENCLDLTTCDLTIRYDNAAVEFVQVKQQYGATGYAEKLGCFGILGLNGEFFSACNNKKDDGEFLLTFGFVNSLNPEELKEDFDIAEVHLFRLYYNILSENISAVEFSLEGDAGFIGRDDLIIDEKCKIKFPCKPGKHTDENFDRICEVCSTEYEVEPCDVNFDGRVDSADARLAYRYSAGAETLSADQLKIADVYKEAGNVGAVTSEDARRIYRVSVGLDYIGADESEIKLTDVSSEYKDALYLEVTENTDESIFINVCCNDIDAVTSIDATISFDSYIYEVASVSVNSNICPTAEKQNSAYAEIFDVGTYFRYAYDYSIPGEISFSGVFLETSEINGSQYLFSITLNKVSHQLITASDIILSSKMYFSFDDKIAVCKNSISPDGIYQYMGYTYRLEDGNATLMYYNDFYGDFVVPEEIKGYPVTGIDGRFFNNESLRTVHIHPGIKEIGTIDFTESDLEYLMSARYIFTNIFVDEANPYYSSEDGVLYNKEKTELLLYPLGKQDVEFIVPDTVNCIGVNAFAVNKYIEKIVMNEGLETIRLSAFLLCSELTSITLWPSVLVIPDFAFMRCDSLSDIYYEGTLKQWESVTVGEGNESLFSAALHFNSENPEASFEDSENARVSENDVFVNSGLDIGELLAHAQSGAVIKDKDGNNVSDNKLPGTGMQLILPDATAYTIVVLGDADGDGIISSSDARLALRASVGLENYESSSPEYKAANVEKEDSISSSDARLILRASVGLEDKTQWMK